MHKKYVLISLVTREKISKEPLGREILSLFYEKYPLLVPQTANFYEPINKPIPDVESALEYWGGIQDFIVEKILCPAVGIFLQI